MAHAKAQSRQPYRKILFSGTAVLILISSALAADQVKTASGVVDGAGKQASGVRIFRGIPYAAPPVGDLRWKPPAPAKNWQGVREAAVFGPRCMQQPVFSDMVFRSSGMNEDCLYLNVWTPAEKKQRNLPVLVYFYGGGFVAGDGSEPRYDGENMATKGIVVVTLSYRLGVFGFFAHPELTKESPHKASGNYGLMDQAAALQWVSQNIAAFGGDPKKITIAGESAGSFSVSAQMVSPLSKNLIRGAIGESGSVLSMPSSPRIVPLADAEQRGVKFAENLKADSLDKLRALSSEQIYEAMKDPWKWQFPLTVDGYFFAEPPAKTYADGKQAHVPLLAGWNSEESNWRAILGNDDPTPENYEKALKTRFGERCGELLKLYPATTRDEVIQSATDLAGDQFIGFGTWKWTDLHNRTGGKAVYRYFYAHPRPGMKNAKENTFPPRGASHSAEIEYALGNLATNEVYAWAADDYKVSSVLQEYFANFIKSGDPNGKNLPEWKRLTTEEPIYFIYLDSKPRSEPEKNRARYLFLDKF
ncbi:MAG TPA: carboxylesterase family protein [Pyrinomonadaceae bacterium]|nr:carboxylesterase family protein [Pyrinomonadaceae bacterium]